MKDKQTRKERRALRKQDVQRRLKRKSRATLITYAVIRLLIIAVMIRSITAGNSENVFTCLLSLFLLYLPSIIERKLEMRLPTALEITVVVPLLLPVPVLSVVLSVEIVASVLTRNSSPKPLKMTELIQSTYEETRTSTW